MPAKPISAISSNGRAQPRIDSMIVSFHMRPPSRNPVAMKKVAHSPCDCSTGKAISWLSA
jgi:hypothetical protein